MKAKFFVFMAIVACAVHAEPTWRNGVLVGEGGKSLYTFDKDSTGQSNCRDGCLLQWPAYTAKAGEKQLNDFGLTAANQQWTYQGKPLYYFIADEKAGDKKGDSVGGVWHLVVSERAKTEGKPVSSSYSY